jgi:hypothetical protein
LIGTGIARVAKTIAVPIPQLQGVQLRAQVDRLIFLGTLIDRRT